MNPGAIRSSATNVQPITMPAVTSPLTPRFPILDTLRAVGAFAVLVTHTAFWTGDYWRNGVMGYVYARLDVGVALFFVLSGFLLSHHYLAKASYGVAQESTGRYLWKRLLRIYPVYVIAVVLAMVFIKGNSDAGIADWVLALTMSDIYFSDTLRHGQTQMWSLATEVSFYLVLPLLMYVVCRGAKPTTRRVVILVVTMFVANVVWTLYGREAVEDLGLRLTAQWLPSYLMWFAAGIALAWAHIRARAGSRNPTIVRLQILGRSPGVCWALIVALLLISATPLAGPTTFDTPSPAESLTKQILYMAIGSLAVVSGVFNAPTSAYTRVISHRIPRHLGTISYGIFCVHLVVLHFVYWATPYEFFRGTHLIPILGMATALSVVLAEVIYRCVELPASRLRNLGRPTTDHPAPATASRQSS